MAGLAGKGSAARLKVQTRKDAAVSMRCKSGTDTPPTDYLNTASGFPIPQEAQRREFPRRSSSMRQLPYLFAAAAISCLALSANPGTASPITSGLANGIATLPAVSNDLVQNVRHNRICRIVRYYDEWDDEWVKERRCYRPSHRPRAFFGAPFVGLHFNFGDDDDRRWKSRRGRDKED